jgi:pimeloyl-ACP methyl ester carboxylesterase
MHCGGRINASVLSRTADIDGPIHFVDFGGPEGATTIVLVHGVGGSHVTWLGVGHLLAHRYRVLAIDLPGHGLSPVAGRRVSAQANQRILWQFVAEVVGTPSVIVGHSMGALTALLEASDRADQVHAAILIDPALPTEAGSQPDWMVSPQFVDYVRSVARERYLSRGRRSDSASVIHSQLRFSCNDELKVSADVVEAYLSVAALRQNQPGLGQAFLEATSSLFYLVNRRKWIRRLMSSVEAPVLLIHGEHDRIVKLEAAKAAAEANPRWQFEVATTAGHVPMLEEPEWTARVIIDWLSRLELRSDDLPKPRLAAGEAISA